MLSLGHVVLVLILDLDGDEKLTLKCVQTLTRPSHHHSHSVMHCLGTESQNFLDMRPVGYGLLGGDLVCQKPW